jgi:hypothetical protein
MPESYFRKTIKRNVASAILTAGLEALHEVLKKKTYVIHSNNMDDAYACAVYYGSSLAYGSDGNACIAYATAAEQSEDIYFTKKEEWSGYGVLNTNDPEITGFFAKQEKVAKAKYRAAVGQGHCAPTAQESHDEFYHHAPVGFGRDWAYEYAKDYESKLPKDKNFHLVVFNAAPYADTLEKGTNGHKKYQVLTCILDDVNNSVDKLADFFNTKTNVPMRKISVTVK